MSYFVYVDRTSDGRPFYVGKGDNGRVRRPKRNALHTNIARKHGVVREVEFASSLESLVLEIEVELIARYKTQHGLEGHWGANLTSGGEGLSNPSPDVRVRMSRSQRARAPDTFETRHRKSVSAKKLNENPAVRQRKSELLKLHVRSLTHRASISRARSKPVVQIDKEGFVVSVYASAKLAEEATGVSRTKICEVCKGIRRYAGGYSWRYKERG